jgi:hypothetical protein
VQYCSPGYVRLAGASVAARLNGGGAVPIYRLFQGQAFEPEQVAMLAQVFDDCVAAIGADRPGRLGDDPRRPEDN